MATEQFDHTSVLQFLEKFTGVDEPNITDWRRDTFGDLTSAFRFKDARKTAPALPGTAATLAAAQYEVANLPKPAAPATQQSLPTQQKGHKPQVP